MREAPAGRAALVDQRVDVTAGPGPCGPGGGDRAHLFRAELGEAADVARRVNDYLLPLECGVEVGYDAHLPAGSVWLAPFGGDREHLRRGAILPSLAERALVELVLVGRLDARNVCSRASPAGPGDRDEPP